MTDELRRSIDRIRKLSPKLNEATDAANRVVLAVEKFLNEECRLGLPAYVSVYFRDGTDPDTGVRTDEPVTTLEYRRIDGKFRIAIGERDDGLDDGPEGPWRYTVWQDSPRGEKLETFPHLTDLLEVLAKKVDSSIEKTQKTCATVEQVMGALTDRDIQEARESAAKHPPIEIGPGPMRTVQAACQAAAENAKTRMAREAAAERLRQFKSSPSDPLKP